MAVSTADTRARQAASRDRQATMPVMGQVLMMTRRSLTTLLRTPASILPNLLISAFFLLIYDSALGGITAFPGPLQGIDYLAFTLPVAVLSATLNAPAGQAMVRDVESGYFDKLLLTPINRSALLLGHVVASGLVIVVQTALILGIAFLIGLRPETGLVAIAVILSFALLIGMGFGGFTVAVALRTGSAAATQGASFIFFPLTFLTTTFLPLDLLQGWLKTVATLNPITYILDASREVLIYGWDTQVVLAGLLACLLVSGLPFLLALSSLRARAQRQ